MSWKVLYVDTMTATIHGELPVQDFTYSETLNGAGSFTATMPLDSTSIARLTNQVAWPRVEADKLEPDGSTQIYVMRDDVPMWSGFVWTRQVDPRANTMQVAGEGIHSYYRRRHIYHTHRFASTDQLTIVKTIFDWANARPGGDVGLNVPTPTASGVLRDRTYYKTEWKPIADMLEQLAAVENGFDFRYRPEWNAGALRTTLDLEYPAGGRATEHVFELGSNVALLAESSDGTNVSTTNWAAGEGTGASMLRKWVVDTSKLGTRPLLEKVYSYADVSVGATLQAHANLDALRGKEPLSYVDVEVLDGQLPQLGGYVVGDRIRVKGAVGYMDIDSTYRLTDRTVTVDSSGGEIVKCGLAPLEVFI